MGCDKSTNPELAGDFSKTESNPNCKIQKSCRTALIAISAFAVCSVAAAVRSRGFIESDGATHFIFARHALEQPIYFVDIWGRPLCTALFAGPAWLGGLLGVRITSLLAAIACAVIAAAIAKGQGFRYPVLALIFTLGQPLLFLHSFSELTELPFAVLIGLAFLSYQRRRWWALAIFAAIAPLGRPEGFVFIVLGAAALLANRKWLAAAILPAGLIAWSVAGHLLVGPADRPWWRWLMDHWPYESGSEYPAGPILYFAGVLPMVVGPFALPAMWIGMWRSLAASWPLVRLKEHAARVDFFLAGIPLAILIGHSLLHWLGKFSSSGSPRYLLIVAPLWGCLAARVGMGVLTDAMAAADLVGGAGGSHAGAGELLLAGFAGSTDAKLGQGGGNCSVVRAQRNSGEVSADHDEPSGGVFLFECQSVGSKPGGAVVAGGDRSSGVGRASGLEPGILCAEFGSETGCAAGAAGEGGVDRRPEGGVGVGG